MNKIMQKVNSFKQWVKKESLDNGRFSIIKCINVFIAFDWAFCKALPLVILLLKLLYQILPSIISLLEKLSDLASTLSYKKKGFFYGFYSIAFIWN